jgi:hypothetical protein
VFKDKGELYDFIKANRMAYHRIIKSTDKILYNTIKNEYIGTKNIGENFWLYCNNHIAALTCRCGTKLLFENVILGYKSKECKSCYNKNRKECGLVNTEIKLQSSVAPDCKNPKCIIDKITGHRQPVIKTKNGIWTDFCSIKCRGQGNSLLSRNTAQDTMLKNHGVKHALQSKIIIDKMISKLQIKHDDINLTNVMDIAKYKKSVIQTKVTRYGEPSSWSTPTAYQAHVDKAASKYGYKLNTFNNVSQIPEIHAKKMKSGFLAKDYILPSGRIIRIQGYEDRFLDKAMIQYKEELFDFTKGAIKYQYNGKLHWYHPDVYVGD